MFLDRKTQQTLNPGTSRPSVAKLISEFAPGSPGKPMVERCFANKDISQKSWIIFL